MSEDAVSMLERGVRSSPRAETVIRLAQARLAFATGGHPAAARTSVPRLPCQEADDRDQVRPGAT